MGFSMDTAAFARKLEERERRTLFAQEVYAHNAAKELEQAAKADAPWKDRSSLARGGLTGRAQRSGGRITISLSGGVHYLVYLELAHKKRYAVLWPTMQKHQQRILKGFAALLK